MRLRIGYVTISDPHDRRSWSGTNYSMMRTLQKHCGEVVPLGPLRPLEAVAGKVVRRALRALGGPNYLDSHSLRLSRKLARIVEARMRRTSCDVLFAPACSTAIAHLETSVPIVYLSDATFRIMVDYYHEFSALIPANARSGEQLERLAIDRARQLIYPSQWAAKSAIADYAAKPEHVHVIPFGANLEAPPPRERAIAVPDRTRCRLLFVGGHWERKGGALAVEAFRALRRRGVACTLTIVGCTPPAPITDDGIDVIPFLDKNAPAQRGELERIYLRSHFMLLPTRAECFSIALCEASAYGLPVLATQTGGLPELVHAGSNGFLLPLDATADAYADVIAAAFDDAERYRELRAASRDQFEARLNWDSWGRAVGHVFEAAVAAC